ncbi:hypothetical protein GEMRC1_004255 [Eukaryota sp. GEM-RC1]
MGIFCSRQRRYSTTQTPTPDVVDDKEDLLANSLFTKLNHEQRLILPSDPTGNQLCIEDCTSCDIIVCRQFEQATVDEANECVLFIGPTSGPVFIRNCSNSFVITACQQLRLRDCSNVKVSLLCKTRPIIESSTNTVFYSYHGVEYQQLPQQLKTAEISPYINCWSNIHDFSPCAGTKNFTLKSGHHSFPLDSSLLSKLSPSDYSPVVPIIRGLRPPPAKTSAVVVMFLCKQNQAKNTFDVKGSKKLDLVGARNKLFNIFSKELLSSPIDTEANQRPMLLRTFEKSLDGVSGIQAPSHISPLFSHGPVLAAEFGGPKE